MGSITNLIGDLQRDPQAFTEIHRRYLTRFTRHANRLLPPGYAATRDGEDLAQSAFRSLWQIVLRDGRLPLENADREGLVAFLALLTTRKVRRHIRWETRQKRDRRRTRTGESPAFDSDQRVNLAELAATSPDAEWQTMYDETHAEFFAALTSRQRQIVQLIEENCRRDDISQLLDVSLRTIERELSTIRSTWEQILSGDDASSDSEF